MKGENDQSDLVEKASQLVIQHTFLWRFHLKVGASEIPLDLISTAKEFRESSRLLTGKEVLSRETLLSFPISDGE